MASITKLTPDSDRACAPKKGTTWCVRGKGSDGRRIHQHRRREGEARVLVASIAAELVGGSKVSKPARARRTFVAYAEEWRQAQTWKDPEPARYALARAYKLLNGTALADVDALGLERLQSTLLGSYERATVELTMHYVKRVTRSAYHAGLLERDVAARVRLPRRDSLDRDGIVTADEVPTHAEALAILAAAPERYRPGVALGLGCGLRVGEVLGVTPSRIDLERGTLRIDNQFQRRGMDSPKTWRGVRTIDLPERVRAELARVVDGAPANLPLLVAPSGGTLRRDGFYEFAWRPALVGAGLAPDRYVFHSARHYCVSAMAARGVPSTEISAYVGDSVATIERTYMHFLRDAPKMAKAALDAALAP
jgi:integrase